MTKCYLCLSPNTGLAFTKNGYQFRRCLDCGLHQLVLTEPYQQLLNRYYNQGYFEGDPAYCAYSDYWGDRHLIQKNMKVYLNEILKIKNRGKLLDVGCSFGLFLDLAEQAGFDPYGIDVSEYAAAKAQGKFGNKIQQADLAKASFENGSFAVICLFDLIEHFADPRQELQRVHQLLKNNGLLIIETGNLESFLARALGQHWHFFAPPQHLFVFGVTQLQSLLDQAGFEVIKTSPHNKWVSLRYVLHLASSIGRVPGSRRLAQTLRRHPLGAWPLYLPLRDKMIVTAKKKPGQSRSKR